MFKPPTNSATDSDLIPLNPILFILDPRKTENEPPANVRPGSFTSHPFMFPLMTMDNIDVWMGKKEDLLIMSSWHMYSDKEFRMEPFFNERHVTQMVALGLNMMAQYN